jgi:hypothetical protein
MQTDYLNAWLILRHNDRYYEIFVNATARRALNTIDRTPQDNGKIPVVRIK